MEILNQYFKNLVFSQVDEKEGFVIYGAGIASGLGGGKQRYVLLFVPTHLAIKNKAHISELFWQNLQTRELPYSYKLMGQQWAIPRNCPDTLLQVSFRDKKYSQYVPVDKNIPLEVDLLHDPRKKTSYQYNNRINLSAAVELFNTTINFIGAVPIVAEQVPSPVSTPNKSISSRMPNIKNWFQAETLEEDDTVELL